MHMRIRAVQISAHGDIDVLQIREVPEPILRDGAVLVRTVASSINPVDWKTRARYVGIGPELPMTLGWDLAGIVVDSSVSEFRCGDRVVAMSHQFSTGLGMWADLVAVPADLLAPAPAQVALTEAATLPLAGSTARQALRAMQLAPGARVLVVGALGAVGSLFRQLAVRDGLLVDGLVSRPSHVAAAEELCDGWVTDAPGELPLRAYDAILDTAGLPQLGVGPSDLLNEAGKYISIVDDPLPRIPRASKIQVREDGAGLASLTRLVDAGELRLKVAEVHPVHAIREAHRRFEVGGLEGKVVIVF